MRACVCVQNYLIGAFGPPCSTSIDFADAETRKQASVKKENGQTVLVPLFLGQESVVGEVRVQLLVRSASWIFFYFTAAVCFVVCNVLEWSGVYGRCVARGSLVCS